MQKMNPQKIMFLLLLACSVMFFLNPMPFVLLAVESTPLPLAINEFMASNGNTIADERGKFSDWIEIANTGSSPVNTGGLYISDEPEEPLKWQIPEGFPSITTIPPGGFLVLWADKEPNLGPLHLGFKLS